MTLGRPASTWPKGALVAFVWGISALAATPARPSAGASKVKLEWNAFWSKWERLAGEPDAARNQSLAPVEALCAALVFARDATLVEQDLDGDGSIDLALWSPSQSCLAWWPRWEHQPQAPPLVFLATCQKSDTRLKLCSGFQLGVDAAASSPATPVIIIRRGRLQQILEDADHSPTGALAVEDLTFDGQPDLLVPTSPGCAGNCWVDVWPFDPRRGRFVASAELAHLANPRVFDAKRHLLDSCECGGQACAVFTARLLEVRESGVRVVALAVQDDASPGSLMKRLKVTSAEGDASVVSCEALVEPGQPGFERVAGTCQGWPLRP